jgi:uncharacterized membrane protein (DUF2068 family)
MFDIDLCGGERCMSMVYGKVMVCCTVGVWHRILWCVWYGK